MSGCTWASTLPVKRWDLTHSVIYVQQGKPVSLLCQVEQVSRPQGKPNGVRVEEVGKSECHPVMGWIGIERKQHHSTGNRADFQLVFHHEKTYRIFERRKANESYD